MKNKILCLSLLLLSTITCIDDIFAAVKIKKMLSFKQLPISNNRFTPMSPKTYDAMVKKLYALAGYSNNWETKEDVTIRNRIVMLSALYECVKFLGLKKYYYDGGGSVFSMDYSWPNIRRIAERLIEEPAKAILPKTFQSLEYEKTVALKKIEENRAALIELLKKIKEIEVGINDGNRQVVDISDEQIDYFITNLCFGKNAVFSVELTEDENEPRLLCERLKVMLKNYSGFQRICSILTMRLINTIMARGGKKEASIKKAKHDEGNAYSFDSDTLFLTADAINGSYCENCYGTDTNKDSSDTVYHEMTHFFHNMVNGRLSDNSQEISSGQALTPLIMYNICNSNLSLVDLFFPALTTSKMKPIVDKIENELKEKADSLKLKENAIYQIYIAVVNNGFGNLLFKEEEIDNLTLKKLSEPTRLAQAIYIKSCVLGDKIPVWTDAEEMITIVGIAPLFVCDNKTYLLEDRQNEEVYNIREETMREDFSSNEDIRKFRYHYTFSYRELSKRINSDLVALSCEQLKPDADMGIDNMKFPEHLPFSSILLEHGESTFTDGEEILKYCEDTLKQYLRQLTPQRQREILDCLNERKYTNSYELLSHIVNEEVGIRGEKCQLSDRL